MFISRSKLLVEFLILLHSVYLVLSMLSNTIDRKQHAFKIIIYFYD